MFFFVVLQLIENAYRPHRMDAFHGSKFSCKVCPGIPTPTHMPSRPPFRPHLRCRRLTSRTGILDAITSQRGHVLCLALPGPRRLLYTFCCPLRMVMSQVCGVSAMWVASVVGLTFVSASMYRDPTYDVLAENPQ